MTRLKICIVEPNQLLTGMYVNKLESSSNYDKPLVFHNRKNLEQYILNHQIGPDLFILDIGLFENQMEDHINRLKSFYPQVMIIMLTEEMPIHKVIKLLNLGINGFVSKNMPVDELCRAIRSVHQIGQNVSVDIASVLTKHLKPQLNSLLEN